jgi:hypothetical protein
MIYLVLSVTVVETNLLEYQAWYTLQKAMREIYNGQPKDPGNEDKQNTQHRKLHLIHLSLFNFGNNISSTF